MSVNHQIIPVSNAATLRLSFDVGHSSIGWAVLETGEKLEIKGCGTVIFRSDDCLASSRRAYRRQRRHIRSTRKRIERLRILFESLGVLSGAELSLPGCAWPWKLAAQVLRGGALLTWPELWDVLRWYAHNRGYDGNRGWSGSDAEADREDSDKVTTARNLMRKHGTGSMAETFCAVCGINPLGAKKSANLPGTERPKGQNAAFPREVVESEVRRILRAHFVKLKAVDTKLEESLFSDWRAIGCQGIKLPKRYSGGLLFGQLLPRFDNRIISRCPVSGEKVPSRNCAEFLRFRWGMLLANIRVGRGSDPQLRTLVKEQRVELDRRMREQGHFTPKGLKEAVRELSGSDRDNLDTMFLHPDAKDSLLFDPVQQLVNSKELQPFWKVLPQRLQNRLRRLWRRGRTFSLGQIRQQVGALGDLREFDAVLELRVAERLAKPEKKGEPVTRQSTLERQFPGKSLKLDGRAPFAKPLLKRAYNDVLSGESHPAEPGGCLFISEKMREARMQRPVAEQTNNHLLRHRLLILGRLLNDILEEYAAGDKTKIGMLTIEVNRDLREMSGKTSKEVGRDLEDRVANHHAVAEKLKEAFAQEGEATRTRITAGLIRKGRIAEDLGWRCPYTGLEYEPKDLITGRVDKDHIVPRSERASDSLDSLALTFSEVNRWKGKRTAWQFVEEEQGKPVPSMENLSVFSLLRYKQFVEKLDVKGRHPDDQCRKKRRKELLLLAKYEAKDFTPRDLTQTSQLARLGAMALRRAFSDSESKPVIVSLPGSVTGAVRKAWRLLGCLGAANPLVLAEDGGVKTKAEVRGVTHLHHALDACVLGLASHFIPNDGGIWEMITKRQPSEGERRNLKRLGIFDFDAENRFGLRDLDAGLKEQIRARLAERRVVSHIPARMGGLRVEQNAWRVVGVKDGKVTLRQRVRQPDGTRPRKEVEEKCSKLLGMEPINGVGKLSKNKAVLTIPENFGVALTAEPTIIPFHKVWPRLREIRDKNGGKLPEIIRNGQLIRIKDGSRFEGLWRVHSVKNNATGIALDIGSPDVVKLQNHTVGHKINVRLASLIRDGLEVIRPSLTGVASCPTISSA